MKFELERTTPFGVAASEVIALLQDASRFFVASGGTKEDSIKYDEKEDLWHAVSKDSIKILPTPAYTAKLDKKGDGAVWKVQAPLGISNVSTWTVEPVSDQECKATEHCSITCNAVAYYPLKYAYSSAMPKAHKSMQEYLS